MIELALYFRCAQLFAHNCHNLVKGPLFLGYHDFFAGLYDGTYDEGYDAVVERMIGLGMAVDLPVLNINAANKAASYESALGDPKAMFSTLLDMERQIAVICRSASAGATVGTANMLADMADKSEMRQYKLKQLLA